MDTGLLNTLLGQGLAIALVLGGAIWALKDLWPYIHKRDREERERRYSLGTIQANAQLEQARSIGELARAIDGFTIVLERLCGPETNRAGTVPPQVGV